MNKLLEPIENSSWVYFLKMDGQFNVNTTQKTITIRPKSDKIRKGSLIRCDAYGMPSMFLEFSLNQPYSVNIVPHRMSHS